MLLFFVGGKNNIMKIFIRNFRRADSYYIRVCFL